MKKLLAIGITRTLLYLGLKAFGLNRFNAYSVVRTLNPRITKVTLTGLSLATDISLATPPTRAKKFPIHYNPTIASVSPDTQAVHRNGRSSCSRQSQQLCVVPLISANSLRVLL